MQNERLFRYAQSQGMAVTAFSPLGQGQSYAKLGHADISVLNDESVNEIASRLGVSCAQVSR